MKKVVKHRDRKYPILSTSIYDLKLIYVCHFHHHFRVTFPQFHRLSRFPCLHHGSLHPRILEIRMNKTGWSLQRTENTIWGFVYLSLQLDKVLDLNAIIGSFQHFFSKHNFGTRPSSNFPLPTKWILKQVFSDHKTGFARKKRIYFHTAFCLLSQKFRESSVFLKKIVFREISVKCFHEYFA